MSGNDRPTALITGASAGIGYELAKEFARHGHDLILVARRREAMETLARECGKNWGTRSELVVQDLAVPGAAQSVFEAVTELGREVDALVNNAGVGNFGFFAEREVETHVNEVQLNVVTLTHLTRLFLPQMLARGSGRILNLSSVGAFLSGPLMSVYYATKAFVLHFSEALHEEVAGSGVVVTALCPGTTHSEFHERAGMLGTGFMKILQFMDADVVARAGYSGLMRGRALVVPGISNKLLLLVLKWTPRKYVRKAVFSLQRSRG